MSFFFAFPTILHLHFLKDKLFFQISAGSGGFGFNPMALAGMMSMFMNQMGNMGGMGNMGAGGGMSNMGMNPRPSGESMGSAHGGDSFRSPPSNNDYKSNNYNSGNVSSSTLTGSEGGLGYGAQNSSMYGGDQGSGNMGDMSQYANAMSAMFGAAGVSPANVQAALYSAYGGGTGGSNSQMGSYDQSSSAYGPSRSTSSRGYKPY